jgi:hypothetical protein
VKEADVAQFKLLPLVCLQIPSKTVKTADITDLQIGIQTRNFVVKKQECQPLNSAFCQPNTLGYSVASTVCRAVPCSLRQLIVPLIRPLSREGRADRGSNIEELHGA